MEKLTMDFGKMLDGLFDFYLTTIKPRKNKKWVYNGYDTTSNCILCTSPSIKEQLSEEEFMYRVNDKNEDPIKLLINASIQLGIQQGINMCTDSPSKYIDDKDYWNFADKVMIKYLKDKENKNEEFE